MERNKADFVDKTILNTPKPTACSTADRRSVQRNKQCVSNQPSSASLEDSLGLSPLNGMDATNVLEEKNADNSVDINYHLQQQRVLANSSLQRANKVAGIPSKYLQPNINISSASNLNISTGSTISETDLLRTPNDASTPRTSVALNNSNDNNQTRLSLGQSMAELSYKIGNTDISIDNFVKEFQKAMKNLDDKEVAPKIDSSMFKPAEEAASMLLADEISWRKQNDMPVSSNLSQVTAADISAGKISVGAFFQQRSDTLSNFQAAVSPVKPKKPTPLIDVSCTSTKFADGQEENENQSQKKSNKSLSISAIQKFLAETEDTPRRVANYLLFQGKNSDEKVNDNSSLPVSKDSSYTSNYSDNDVMQCIVADKENVDVNNIQDKAQYIKSNPKETSETENRPSYVSSRSSSRTSSTLTNLPSGKLPIESTRMELIWGTVKVDKCVTQDFLIRNKTPKRLGLQMSISGHEFKFRKDSRQESDPLSAAKIILHPHESRPVIISFIPTKVGAAVDEIVFTPLDPNMQQTKKQCVRLFGYGGYGRIELYNLTKDTTGKFWLSLGKLDDCSVITKSFTLKNTGSLPAFAYISFSSKELFAFANVAVTPSFLVLIPNEQKEIVISYSPSAEDHKVSRQSLFNNTMVAEIGNLLVISGSEVNRGRLRRMCRKCTEKNLTVDPLSNILKQSFANEVMPPDLVTFKESPSSLKEILKLFSRNEIVLTLEQDPEQTLMPQYPDDSGMFHSLYQDNSVVGLDNTRLEASCKLEPASIILISPTKLKDSLFLISETDKTLHYEVTCDPEGLEITPKAGVIRSGQEVVLNLTCPKLPTNEKRLFKVLVYVENEVFEASVKITFIKENVRKK